MKVGLLKIQDEIDAGKTDIKIEWNSVDWMFIDKEEALNIINHLIKVFDIDIN